MTFSNEQQVKNIVSRETGVHYHALNDDLKLSDLGLDSLEFLELIQQVETECGCKIPDALIAKMETVGDLARAIA